MQMYELVHCDFLVQVEATSLVKVCFEGSETLGCVQDDKPAVFLLPGIVLLRISPVQVFMDFARSLAPAASKFPPIDTG